LLTEKQLQKSVIEYLKIHPKIAWSERFNVGAHLLINENSRRFIRYSFKGCSDILGQLKDGRFLAVEVKSAKGKVTECQQQFIDCVNTNGGLGVIVRSIDDINNALKK